MTPSHLKYAENIAAGLGQYPAHIIRELLAEREELLAAVDRPTPGQAAAQAVIGEVPSLGLAAEILRSRPWDYDPARDTLMQRAGIALSNNARFNSKLQRENATLRAALIETVEVYECLTRGNPLVPICFGKPVTDLWYAALGREPLPEAALQQAREAMNQ